MCSASDDASGTNTRTSYRDGEVLKMVGLRNGDVVNGGLHATVAILHDVNIKVVVVFSRSLSLMLQVKVRCDEGQRTMPATVMTGGKPILHLCTGRS
jgi:hypothetical protein